MMPTLADALCAVVYLCSSIAARLRTPQQRQKKYKHGGGGEAPCVCFVKMHGESV